MVSVVGSFPGHPLTSRTGMEARQEDMAANMRDRDNDSSMCANTLLAL